MQQYNTYIMLAQFVAIVVLFFVVLRQGTSKGFSSDGSISRADHEDAIEKLNILIRDVERRAEKAEVLLNERNTECSRLSDTVAALRKDIEAEQRNKVDLSSQVSSLAAKQKADAEVIAARKLELDDATIEKQKLRDKVETEQQAQQALKAQISSLRTQIEADKVAADEKIALLTKVGEEMQARFKALAEEALKVQGEAFSKANVERLEATLTPLKEHVGHFEKELREVHQETVKDRERLKTEIAQLTRRSEEISQEAVALTRALKGDQQKQGAWGEMILEGILERSGLRAGEEYETQVARTSTDGDRLRPDVVVKLPGDKTLIIDSKVSLVAYSDAVNSDDETFAQGARKRHVLSLRQHINLLSSKGYQLAENQTVDYVILFVPIEGAFSEALREDGKLTEYALEKNITIATPTTLMMALKTIASVWAVERRNRNAELIAERAGRLYDKVVGFMSNMERVGKGISQASGAYDDAINQLARGRGNLLGQIETLKSLGAKTTKALPGDFDEGIDPDGETLKIES